MNNVSTKLLVGTVVVTALLTVVFPAPVAAESGTVSVNAPDSASPGDEVTVSFKVTNTGEEPSSYILDLSLPEGYTITDRVDNDGQWKSGESKWLWQTIETGNSDTKVVEIDVETPEDASSSGTISAELKTATGIEETTSISIIESRSDGKHSITGEIVDFDGNSIENTGDTEVTISRIDTDGDSSIVLVDSIRFSDFDTLASANSDVSSASFSENGNDPATYRITLLGDGLSRYQITADRADYEPFSATTGPLDADESTAQNIVFNPTGRLNYKLNITVADDEKSISTPIDSSVPIKITATQQNSGVPVSDVEIDVDAVDPTVGKFTTKTVVTDVGGKATTTFTGTAAGKTNISARFTNSEREYTTNGKEQAAITVFETAQITGDIINDRNDPLRSAEVTLFMKENKSFEQLESTTTGSSSSFTFTGVRAGLDYRIEASVVDGDGTKRTGSTTLSEIPRGTNTADVVIQDVDEPKSSDIILEDTISSTGSKVTIVTDNASAIAVSELPEDVKISDISDGGTKVDGGILYTSFSSELPATVSFRLNPDSGAYSDGDTVDFVVGDSSVSLDVVSQSEVQISSVELSPKKIATGTSTHDLRINVEDLSTDDEPDVFTITIPKNVEVVDVNVADSNVDLTDRPSATNTMEFAVNPTETTTAELELELILSKATNSPPLPPETP